MAVAGLMLYELPKNAIRKLDHEYICFNTSTPSMYCGGDWVRAGPWMTSVFAEYRGLHVDHGESFRVYRLRKE